MKKIGVIGATGMIGHHVSKQIMSDQDARLFVIHRKSSDLSNINDLVYESRIADLNEKESLSYAFQGLDYVLNCGAYYPSIPKSLNEEIRIAKTQAENFIDAVSKSGLQKGLYLGAAIAIPQAENGIGDESLVYKDSPKNKAAYVQVKWIMDKLMREAGAGGVPVVIGIPSMTFGEYDFGPSTGRLIVNAVNQTLPGFVAGNRNVVYAGDVAKGLLKACMNGKSGERYLITGENISMEDLVAAILKVSGKAPMPKEVSLSIAKIISKLKMWRYSFIGGELPLLDETAIAVMSAGQFLNGDKAKDLLDYSPLIGVEEMLSKSIDWFKQHGYIRG